MIDNFAHRAAEWDSTEKVEMTELFVAELLQKITVLPHWKALEIGAGTGLVGMQLLDKVQKMVFEDTSPAMLDVLRTKPKDETKVEILVGEVYEYATQDIDLVVSCMAFHHLPDIKKTLEHLFRITNPKAVIAIADLLEEDGSFHRFEPIPHKGFDVEKLSQQFINAGFELTQVAVYNTLKRERVKGVLSSYDQFLLVAQKV